jgi:AcrR family transcriptional regulator
MANTTKNRIVSAALALFSEKGYDGAGMEEIAKAVGIRKASIYSHFRGKEEILANVFDCALTEYSEYLNGIVPRAVKKDIKASLFEIFMNYVNYFMDQEKLNFWMKLYMTPPPFLREDILRRSYAIESAFMSNIHVFFQRASDMKVIGSGNTHAMATAFYHLMTGLGMTASFYQLKSLRKMVKECIEVLWNGLSVSS